MKAAGKWTWWNPFGTVPLETCVRRCQEAGIGCIVKANYNSVLQAFQDGGVRTAIERYCYPDHEAYEAASLADGIRRGAGFIVLDPEVEWEPTDAGPMTRLLDAIVGAVGPDVEIYSCVDTRGNRTTLPYQRVLGNHASVKGIMPMIYPLDFYPHRPTGYVAQAFHDSLDGKMLYNKPVLPTTQGYGGIGAAAVVEELRAAAGYPGLQLYTVCHATIEEWTAFAGHTAEEQADMAAKEDLERKNAQIAFGNILERLMRQAYNGQSPSLDDMAAVEYVFALAKAHR